MIDRNIKIINKLGLHARAAAKLVKLASRFESDITIGKEGEGSDCKSILGILSLAAAKGTTVIICCSGPDELSAADAIVDLFSRKFDEPE